MEGVGVVVVVVGAGAVVEAGVEDRWEVEDSAAPGSILTSVLFSSVSTFSSSRVEVGGRFSSVFSSRRTLPSRAVASSLGRL